MLLGFMSREKEIVLPPVVEACDILEEINEQ